jgi:NADPH:quinone reductase
VGLAAVQLAKANEMTVIGTAGSNAGIDLLKSQGTDFVFNHKEKGYMDKIKELCPDGVDIVLEMLANVNLNNDLQIIRFKKGRVVVIRFLNILNCIQYDNKLKRRQIKST